jgi:adhesin transport system membrane fusion protein
MSDQDKQPLGKIDPVKKPASETKNEGADGKALNTQKGFAETHRSMFGAMDRMEAYGEKMLVTDEDLPLYKHLLLFVIIIIFAAFIGWANWATLDEVTRGEGKVIPSSEIQQIQHQEGGTVAAFLKREGERVEQGEVLIRLRDIGAASDLGASTARYQGLQAKKFRLMAEAEGLATPEFPDEVIEQAPESVQEELNTFISNQSRMKSQVTVFEQQSRQRRQEVNEINTRIRDTKRMLDLTQQELSMTRQAAERGNVPRMEMLQLEQRLAEQQSQMNGMRASLPRANSAIREAEARIRELQQTAKTEAQNELGTTFLEIKTIEKTLGALEDTKDRTDIVSPVNGIIKDFRFNTVGGVVKPGEVIAEIVPDDDLLLVEANIRPADIAFIHPGQKAVVKITAYDFSIYGGLEGEVIDISADTIENQEGESFYRIRVQTKEKELKRKGEILPIIPGMVAGIDILTGEKTVMDYILKPFKKTLENSMNER